MSKMIKGMLIGGVIGAGIGAVQAYQREDPTDLVAQQALRAGAQGLLVGGFVGFVFDRRSRRRATAEDLTAGAAALSAITGLAQQARPHVQHAAEVARELAHEARPHVEHAAEVAQHRARELAIEARPHVEHAAEVAQQKAREAARQARPHVEHAAEVARERVAARRAA